MHTLKVFRSPMWLLLDKLSSPHYRYIRKMRRGDRLPLTQRAEILLKMLKHHKPSSNNKTLNARLLARVITGCHYT